MLHKLAKCYNVEPIKEFPMELPYSCPICRSLRSRRITELPMNLEKVAEVVDSAVDDLKLSEVFSSDNLAKASGVLLQKLEHGIPISSSGKLSLSDIRGRLDEFVNSHEPFTASSDEAYGLLKCVEETPSTTAEIITAGWELRVEKHISELCRIFNDANLGLPERFETYMEYLDAFDNCIHKSIETSAIHRLWLGGEASGS